DVEVQSGRLVLRRQVDESGCLVVPWDVPGAGRLMGMTASLMERAEPYHFLVELARGKVNQLRCQAADWQATGLRMPPDLSRQIRDASISFGRAVTHATDEQTGAEADATLRQAYDASAKLVKEYTAQMFQARHQQYPRL